MAIFTSKLLGGEVPTIHGDGEQTRDFVFVDDVAHAFVLATSKGSAETVNIGTGVQTTINELYRAMADAAGFDGDAVHGPPRPGDVRFSALDPSKAEKVLGWQAWTTVAEGAKATIEHFRARAT